MFDKLKIIIMKKTIYLLTIILFFSACNSEAPVEEIDLMIRTGGDKRISNFLLYHLAYSELLFVDTLWPDFSQKEYSKCLNHFMKVERRFGKRI